MTDHLTSLPPELLLLIISVLPVASNSFTGSPPPPSPTANRHPFDTLARTCRYLRAFIHINAAIIHNAYILTHHRTAAQILRSRYSSTGWLLPTHPCILAAEERMVRDKIVSSGCYCVSCRCYLQTQSASGPEPSLASDIEVSGVRSHLFSCDIRLPASPSLNMATTKCKLTTEINHVITMKLSLPGPQFAIFLERYAWEIETRYQMFSASSSSSFLPVFLHDATAPSSSEREEGLESMTEQDIKFSFTVGNYCVRRFLSDVHRNLADLNGADTPATSNIQTIGTRKQRESAWNVWRWLERWRIARYSENAALRERGEGNDGLEPGRMMFGEILSLSSASSPADALTSTHLSEKSCRGRRVDDWMAGLIWYHGITATSATSANRITVNTARAMEKDGQDVQEKNKKGSQGGLRKSLEGIRKMGTAIRAFWR